MVAVDRGRYTCVVDSDRTVIAMRLPLGDQTGATASAPASVIGRGLAGYDSAEAALIAGRNSQAILDILGAPGRSAIIHRDDMVIL